MAMVSNFGVLQATRDLFNVVLPVQDRNRVATYDNVLEVIGIEISALFIQPMIRRD